MASQEEENLSSSSSLLLQDDDNLVDITDLVEECAASLTLADPFLCNTASFSLHDAMAASPLGDRKMDCCEIPIELVAPYGTEIADKDDRMVFPRPAPTGLNDDFTPLKWETLTVSDAAFIGLHILVRLESLLSGASVGESTFTCLYAHAPVLADMRARLFPNDENDDDSHGLVEQLEKSLSLEESSPSSSLSSLTGTPAQLAVFACSLALVEASDLIRGIILSADIYEEEDFVSSTNDITTYTEHCEDIDILQILTVALQATKSVTETEPLLVQIIQEVLCFLTGFLSSSSTLAKLKTGSLHQKLQESKRLAQMASENIDSLLTALNELTEFQAWDEVKATLHQSFDSYVNRPLVGNAPVRKVHFREPTQALIRLKTISEELDWAVGDLVLTGNSLGRIRRILDRVTQASANILTRSLVILILYFGEKVLGQYPLRDLIIQDMRQWTHIPKDFFSSEHAEAFLNRLAKPIYDTLKLRTLSKNRQRAYIEIVMFPEWASLQNEAQMIDMEYRQAKNLDNSAQPYFTQYALTIVIRLMERHVASGMELGLFYGHEEISYACWYRDFLLSGLLNNLSLMKREKAMYNNKTAAESPTKSNSKAHRGKKKNYKKSSNGNSEVKVTAEDREDELELTILGLKRNLCRGTTRFLAGLRQAGVLRDNVWEFTSTARIFATRFQSFELIQQPPVLTYEYYAEGSDFSRVTPQDLLHTTAEWFQSCKKTVDQLLAGATGVLDTPFAPIRESELRCLLKVCIGNSVYVQKLRQVAQDDPTKTKVDFDFSAHPEFCMIKLS